MEPDRVGAAIFESFFLYWGLRAAAERFEPDQAEVLGTAMAGLSLSLLDGDEHGWFEGGDREGAIVEAVNTALDDLESRLGQRHVRVDLGRGPHGTARPSPHVARRDIRDAEQGRRPPSGAAASRSATRGSTPTYLAAVGANYRINAELSDDPPGLWAVDTAGPGPGNPGSANYCDQLGTWLAGEHYYFPLDRERVEKRVQTRLTINGG